MEPASTHPGRPRRGLRDLDRSVERILGADIRLLYGLLIPILIIVGFVIALALNHAAWLVGVILVLELAALMLVVVEIFKMMGDEQGADDPRAS